jgi:SnoaL-like domain
MEAQHMTETDAATPISTVVDGYFAMWNEADPARRRELIAAAWSPDARYVDPMFAADGADALDALVAGVHEQFPGHRFRLTSAVDVHHGRARWGWELAGPDGGAPVAGGVDFAVLASRCSRPTAGCARSPASSNSQPLPPSAGARYRIE